MKNFCNIEASCKYLSDSIASLIISPASSISFFLLASLNSWTVFTFKRDPGMDTSVVLASSCGGEDESAKDEEKCDEIKDSRLETTESVDLYRSSC